MQPVRSLLAIAVLVAVTISTAHGAAQKYTHPQFADVSKNHKLVAVLPFKVNTDMKNLPKNMTPEMLEQSEKDDGLEIQKVLYARLLQRSGDGEYTITFQDVDQTNALPVGRATAAGCDVSPWPASSCRSPVPVPAPLGARNRLRTS